MWKLTLLEPGLLGTSIKPLGILRRFAILRVACPQCVSSSAFKGCFWISSLPRTSQWPQQSVFFLVLLLLMFSFLEQLSIAFEVLAVKFYIAFFDVRFFVSILCLLCECSLRCVFSGRGRFLLRRDMISCLSCFFFKNFFFVFLLLPSCFLPRCCEAVAVP